MGYGGAAGVSYIQSKMGYGGAAGVSYIQSKMGYGGAAGVSYIQGKMGYGGAAGVQPWWYGAYICDFQISAVSLQKANVDWENRNKSI
jgi:hypothetical protein